jgi:hypothetical protein
MSASTICGSRDGLDDLAADEDLALAVAGGDAEVGLAGLAASPFSRAAHDGDAQRHLEARQPGGDLLGEGVDVDLGRARSDGQETISRPPLAQVERLEDTAGRP